MFKSKSKKENEKVKIIENNDNSNSNLSLANRMRLKTEAAKKNINVENEKLCNDAYNKIKEHLTQFIDIAASSGENKYSYNYDEDEFSILKNDEYIQILTKKISSYLEDECKFMNVNVFFDLKPERYGLGTKRIRISVSW